MLLNFCINVCSAYLCLLQDRVVAEGFNVL